MDQTRTDQAMARIEAAMARIEQASADMARGSRADPAASGNVGDGLRRTLLALDQLIADLER